MSKICYECFREINDAAVCPYCGFRVNEYVMNERILVIRDSKTYGSNTLHMVTGSGQEDFQTGLKRYVKEAAILSKFFDLPGIVSVKDFFYDNGTAYMAMEYIDGISLKDYLKQRGNTVSAAETLKIVKPIIESLAVVHQNKLLHRDISPDNIMISNNGMVKLIDFGAARYFEGRFGKEHDCSVETWLCTD